MTLLARTNSSINMNFAKLDAIDQAGAFLSGPFTDFAVWVDTPTTLSNMQTMSLEEQIADANPECADLADQNEPLMNYLRDALGNFSIQSCADAIGYCNSLTSMPNWGVDGGRGFVTRMLCSTTCGCNDPGGEFIFVQGCPSKECLQTERYQSLLQQGSCEDLTVDELRNFTPWVSWVQQLRSYAASPGNQLPGQEEVGVLAEAMWDYGCDFKVPMSTINITWSSCLETWRVSKLTGESPNLLGLGWFGYALQFGFHLDAPDTCPIGVKVNTEIHIWALELEPRTCLFKFPSKNPRVWPSV